MAVAAVTVRVPLAVFVTELSPVPVPVTVKVLVTAATEEGTVSVIVEFEDPLLVNFMAGGEKDAVTPDGKPLAESATVSEVPLLPLMFTVTVYVGVEEEPAQLAPDCVPMLTDCSVKPASVNVVCAISPDVWPVAVNWRVAPSSS